MQRLRQKGSVVGGASEVVLRGSEGTHLGRCCTVSRLPSEETVEPGRGRIKRIQDSSEIPRKSMNLFREFVAQNLLWFSGRLPETEESLAQAERTLGVRIPDDLRWLLANHGYAYATGIDSLAGTVQDTIEARSKVNLPNRFLVLKNNGYETCAVLLDTFPETATGENPVHFVDWECIGDVIDPSTSEFRSYMEYARKELENERAFLSGEKIELGPSEYRCK